MNQIIQIVKTKRILSVSILLYALLTVWWIIIWLGGTKTAQINNDFGFVYGGFSLWGALWGFRTARLWGGHKSLMGRAILSLAIGLLLQGFGQYSFWFINVFLHIDIPYPGIPDIGYFGTIPFYIYAALMLVKASGASISLKLFRNQLHAIIIPLVLLVISYALILKNYTFDLNSPLTGLLDFGYPLGQLTYTAIALVTYSVSRKILGGMMKRPISILIAAFFIQFVADYSFVYFKDSFYPASFIDFIYLTAYFLMTLGIIQLRTTAMELKK
jgi:hypothetical protein